MTATTAALTERIFLTVFPLFVIVLSGYLYGRKREANIEFANRANMDLFLPALIFHALATQAFPLSQYQALAIGGTAVILGSGLICYPILRALGLNRQTFLPPMMFNNSGNLGLPLMVLAFGEDALPAAVILFIIENTLHMSLGVAMIDRKSHPVTLLKMPMTVATIIGVVWSALALPLPEAARLPIEMLGQISIPLMLFTLGIRIAQVGLPDWRLGLFGAILCPASGLASALAVLPFLDLDSQQAGMLLVFGALPPAVLNYMIAEKYQQQPATVASVVLMGNMSSLAIIPAVLAYVLR